MERDPQPAVRIPDGPAVFDPSARRVVPEVMDQPGLDLSLHHQALAALRRVNWLSRTADSLWPAIVALARERQAAGDLTPLTLLDVACGGGDVVLRLAHRARLAGISLQIRGCDISETAIRFAQKQTSQKGETGSSFFVHDILTAPLPDAYDIVTCTLFLHHLEGPQAGQLLRNLAAAARKLVLVSDLRRTRLGFWMAHLVARVVTRSPVVRVDGPLSVAAALSLEEVDHLAKSCGWTGFTLRRVWPERFLLTWKK